MSADELDCCTFCTLSGLALSGCLSSRAGGRRRRRKFMVDLGVVDNKNQEGWSKKVGVNKSKEEDGQNKTKIFFGRQVAGMPGSTAN